MSKQSCDELKAPNNSPETNLRKLLDTGYIPKFKATSFTELLNSKEGLYYIEKFGVDQLINIFEVNHQTKVANKKNNKQGQSR